MTEQTNDAATWHWTNGDHTEARNGRWVAFRFELADQWRLAHDDFDVPRPMCLAYEGDTDDGMSHADAAANRKMIDFLTWRAEQDVPEEPTEFGYVGTLVDPGGDEWDVTRNRLGSYPWSVVNRRTGDYALHATWADARGTNEFEQAVRS